MGSNLPSLLAFSCLLWLVQGRGAAPPGQVYWDAMLPNTPMPGAIRDILYPTPPHEMSDEKVTPVGMNVSSDSGSGRSGNNHLLGVGDRNGRNNRSTHVGVNIGSSSNNKGQAGNDSRASGASPSGAGGGETNITEPAAQSAPTSPTVFVRVDPYYWRSTNPFQYRYGAAENQLHDDPSAALFFLQKDLRRGENMTLRFTRSSSITPDSSAAYTTFLPRGAAGAIPFSSAHLLEILARFSVDPTSVKARLARKTLRECEEPAEEGVTKKCVTSLESMVDYATSMLATTEVTALSTRMIRGAGERRRRYTVTSSSNVLGSNHNQVVVVCHYQPYMYAVYYCHITRSTQAVTVRMVSAWEKDDIAAAVEAVAVCHEDTSKWNPAHLAFHILNVKPGEAAICHFLPQDHVIWARRPGH